MARVLVIVPFPLGESGIANRAAQLEKVELGPGIEFDFRGVRAGPALLDSGHDTALAAGAPAVDSRPGGQEGQVLPLLRAAGLACVEEEGAQVIGMGSTTMHQAVPYLQAELPVPIINPGPLSYKLAELVLGLGLTQSKQAYPFPNVPKPDMLAAMMEAAEASERTATTA